MKIIDPPSALVVYYVLVLCLCRELWRLQSRQFVSPGENAFPGTGGGGRIAIRVDINQHMAKVAYANGHSGEKALYGA